MVEHKPNPVDSFEKLRDRVERFIRGPARPRHAQAQLSLGFGLVARNLKVESPRTSVSEFLGFMSDSLPGGGVYIFGGVLRDLALLGRRGFSSDIDVVVEGNWDHCIRYLQTLGAHRNKFGGYRLEIAGWPVDIWNSRDTWAIRNGFVKYDGIASLTHTTVLNWDAILMNWRTRTFVCRDDYLSSLQSRILDVVLRQNPNPLGMAVRVFRHLGVKDARQVTASAAEYLADCTTRYSFDELRKSEIRSYGNASIELSIYNFFEILKKNEHLEMRERFQAASERARNEGIATPRRQAEWSFDDFVNSHEVVNQR